MSAVDNFPARYLLNDVCVLERRTLVDGAVLEMTGVAMTTRGGETTCYRCLFPVPPPPATTPACSEAGVLGPVPGVIGAIQALEALKVLTGAGEPLYDRLLQFDGAALTLPRGRGGALRDMRRLRSTTDDHGAGRRRCLRAWVASRGAGPARGRAREARLGLRGVLRRRRLEPRARRRGARASGPDRVVAFTAASETYLPQELVVARSLAADLGVAHVVVADPRVRRRRLHEQPARALLHLQDPSARRDGAGGRASTAAPRSSTAPTSTISATSARACAPPRNAACAHPLIAAGIGKAEVRRLARELGLPTWDAPQQACLASRIPYGQPITAEKLHAIAAAEEVLRELGFRQCRVRHHGPVARVEVEADGDRPRRRRRPARRSCAGSASSASPTSTLDLAGFRSGSMNEA